AGGWASAAAEHDRTGPRQRRNPVAGARRTGKAADPGQRLAGAGPPADADQSLSQTAHGYLPQPRRGSGKLMRLLENSRVLDDILAGQPILPVLSITRESDILPMADALAAASITNLEVTLRTPLGLGAIRLLDSERPQPCVGAGSVPDARPFQSVLSAGARFDVTPG